MAHLTAVSAVVQVLRSGAEVALRRARASGAAASARLDEDLGSEPPLLAISLAAADALDAAREVQLSMLGLFASFLRMLGEALDTSCYAMMAAETRCVVRPRLQRPRPRSRCCVRRRAPQTPPRQALMKPMAPARLRTAQQRRRTRRRRQPVRAAICPSDVFVYLFLIASAGERMLAQPHAEQAGLLISPQLF